MSRRALYEHHGFDPNQGTKDRPTRQGFDPEPRRAAAGQT